MFPAFPAFRRSVSSIWSLSVLTEQQVAPRCVSTCLDSLTFLLSLIVTTIMGCAVEKEKTLVSTCSELVSFSLCVCVAT